MMTFSSPVLKQPVIYTKLVDQFCLFKYVSKHHVHFYCAESIRNSIASQDTTETLLSPREISERLQNRS